MKSDVELEIIFKDPSLLINAFESVKNFIEKLSCVVSKSSAWIIASCEDVFIKATIPLYENVGPGTGATSKIIMKLEGDTNRIVRIVSELSSIVKKSNGGLILKL
ncbi:MAG: hypothetical protein F7B11_03560 [Caldisphaeraceae archaeon]|nr:hypothetical protein [Caldisphaeraceae archaeon]